MKLNHLLVASVVAVSLSLSAGGCGSSSDADAGAGGGSGGGTAGGSGGGAAGGVGGGTAGGSGGGVAGGAGGGTAGGTGGGAADAGSCADYCATFSDLTAADAGLVFDFTPVPRCVKVKVNQQLSINGASIHPMQQVCGPVTGKLDITDTSNAHVTFQTSGIYGADCVAHGTSMNIGVQVVP